MLTEYEEIALLKCFPNAELSYETIIHNKVQNADFILAIPEGKKYFAWFTVFKKQNVCILMEIGINRQICGIQLVQCCFNDTLSFGTIFYGTIFKYDNHRFFSIENLHQYKGIDCSETSLDYKLKTLGIIFSREIEQQAYTPYSIIFGLPVLTKSLSDLMKTIPLLPYKIKYLQFRENKKNQSNDCFNMIYNDSISLVDHTFDRGIRRYESQGSRIILSGSEKKSIVFEIKPDIQNDIYHLFSYNEHYYGIAYIPNYKTSVMMNKLFRNIKENSNLDALEESDDETEFENTNEDKFVYLERTHNMVCEYNYKFKKWEPIRLAQKNEKVITGEEIARLEKNNK